MNIQFERAFLFGCSFTKYHYPTWADILKTQVNFPVYNFGIPGFGNVGILHEMVKCDIKYKLTNKDLIIVMWSAWSREDRYLNGSWASYGNVLNNDYYGKEFVKKHWSWENDIIKNSTAIILANKVFKIDDQYCIIKFGHWVGGQPCHDDSEVFNFYKEKLPDCECFDADYYDNQRFHPSNLDLHPDILCHVNFYNKNIAKKFNFKYVESNSKYHHYQKLIADKFASVGKDRISYEESKKLIKKNFPYPEIETINF